MSRLGGCGFGFNERRYNDEAGSYKDPRPSQENDGWRDETLGENAHRGKALFTQEVGACPRPAKNRFGKSPGDSGSPDS